MNISITKTTTPKVKPEASSLGFGKYFSDHMFIMDYSNDKGWYNARIVPFENISLILHLLYYTMALKFLRV